VAAAALSTAQAADARSIGRCRLPERAKVEARNRTVLVYTVDGARLDWEPKPVTLLYACRRASGERLRIWYERHETDWDEHNHDYRVAGHFVAWVDSLSDHDDGARVEYISVYDVARAKLTRDWYVASRDDDRVPVSTISSLTLTRDGDVAWALRTYDHPPLYVDVEPRERRRVELADQFGRVVLDAGRGIDLKSVSITGGRVRWVDQGARRSERLYATGHRVPCSFPRGARRRARTLRAVAYSYDTHPWGRLVRHIRACTFRSGRRRVMADIHPGDQRVRRLRLAGPFAGFVLYSFMHPDGSSQRLEARSIDLRSGRTKWTSVLDYNPAEPRAIFGDGEFVMAINGAFAYIVTERWTHAHTSTWVNRVRARYPGGGGTLDAGLEIDVNSLRLHGFTATWDHGGKQRSQLLR
jgi:hypothetical protein